MGRSKRGPKYRSIYLKKRKSNEQQKQAINIHTTNAFSRDVEKISKILFVIHPPSQKS
jgi:hypothetical protein